MPNHVTNKITFSADVADEVFSAVCPNGLLDFELLVPSPPNKYRGSLGREEDKDFPINWDTWNRSNWGTKWNCYGQSTGIGEDGAAFIKFDTAWSVPYPILVAFANKFQTHFEVRYFDEGSNFWGIEEWGTEEYCGALHRLNKRRDNQDDYRMLCIELKGYDPEAEEE